MGRKGVRKGYSVGAEAKIILGQEQDSFGGDMGCVLVGSCAFPEGDVCLMLQRQPPELAVPDLWK